MTNYVNIAGTLLALAILLWVVKPRLSAHRVVRLVVVVAAGYVVFLAIHFGYVLLTALGGADPQQGYIDAQRCAPVETTCLALRQFWLTRAHAVNGLRFTAWFPSSAPLWNRLLVGLPMVSGALLCSWLAWFVLRSECPAIATVTCKTLFLVSGISSPYKVAGRLVSENTLPRADTNTVSNHYRVLSLRQLDSVPLLLRELEQISDEEVRLIRMVVPVRGYWENWEDDKFVGRPELQETYVRAIHVRAVVLLLNRILVLDPSEPLLRWESPATPWQASVKALCERFRAAHPGAQVWVGEQRQPMRCAGSL